MAISVVLGRTHSDAVALLELEASGTAAPPPGKQARAEALANTLTQIAGAIGARSVGRCLW